MKTEVEVLGKSILVEADLGGRVPRVRIDGREVAAEIVWLPGRELRLTMDGRTFDVLLGDAKRDAVDVTVGCRRLRVGFGGPASTRGRRTGSRAGTEQVVAPMPGKVVALLVEPGQAVAAGQGVVVVEAMKMENELTTTISGVVQSVLVKVGQVVETDERLVEIVEGP